MMTTLFCRRAKALLSNGKLLTDSAMLLLSKLLISMVLSSGQDSNDDMMAAAEALKKFVCLDSEKVKWTNPGQEA